MSACQYVEVRARGSANDLTPRSWDPSHVKIEVRARVEASPHCAPKLARQSIHSPSAEPPMPAKTRHSGGASTTSFLALEHMQLPRLASPRRAFVMILQLPWLGGLAPCSGLSFIFHPFPLF